MGFHKAAKYYYYPGWHEPCAVLELIVNKSAFDALTPDLQTIVRTAAARSNGWMLAELEAKNNAALQELTGQHKVQLRAFPDEVLAQLRTYAGEVIEEVVAADPMSKKVFESYNRFRKDVGGWANLSEKMYYSKIST